MLRQQQQGVGRKRASRSSTPRCQHTEQQRRGANWGRGRDSDLARGRGRGTGSARGSKKSRQLERRHPPPAVVVHYDPQRPRVVYLRQGHPLARHLLERRVQRLEAALRHEDETAWLSGGWTRLQWQMVGQLLRSVEG